MSVKNERLNSGAAEETNREFVMTDRDFKRIKAIAYEVTGISLSDQKKNMIYGRLARRLRSLNLKSFEIYCDLLTDEESGELHEFTNSITTNLTAFFRENHHFEQLKNVIIPELLVKNAASKRIRIWSAGCSTGEEPYSIAMVLKSCTQLNTWDVKVLATDLDTNVVAKGASGVYAVGRVEDVAKEYHKFFERANGEEITIRDDVRRLITFKQLNLLHEWPMNGPFDLIFCRNVVIYFDAPTQLKLFNRYADILKQQGYLFIGHSENLQQASARFANLGRTMYRRLS